MKVLLATWILMLIIAGTTQAQENLTWDRDNATEKEIMGYTCSAQLMIMTMGDSQEFEPNLEATATYGGMLLSQLASFETMERTGQAMSIGEVVSIRDQEIGILMARFNIAPDEIIKESNFCLSWAETVLEAIEQNSEITPEQISLPSQHSIDEPSSSRLLYIESAFRNWKKSGYVKPSDLREALRRQLQQ